MIKFHYYDSVILNEFVDKQDIHPYFKQRKWNKQSGYLKSRVHEIDCPLPLASTVCPMPRDLNNVELDFSKVMDSITESVCNSIIQKNQQPYLFYSGGVDSVSILVAMLRNANKDFLERLTIVCNRLSFQENPYFYDRFIKDKFSIIDTDVFKLDQTNFDDVVILDGEMGNQIMGSVDIYDYVFKNQFDVLSDPYENIFKSSFTEQDLYVINSVIESLKFAPIKIRRLHDFLWWANFNFRTDHVLLHKISIFTGNMDSDKRKLFFKNNIVRIYSHEEMQKWSLATVELRLEYLKKTTKYFPKKYIFDFDKNEIWFLQKKEMTSPWFLTSQTSSLGNFKLALDENWKLWDIRDRETRQFIKQFYQ